MYPQSDWWANKMKNSDVPEIREFGKGAIQRKENCM